MYFLEKADVLDIFSKEVKEKKEKTFAVYINSPFCIRQCSFCMHMGELIEINDVLYQQYFNNYLPSLIEFYKPVFLEKTPDIIYFGGGTSSVMTPEVMRNIFSKIPNFKNIKEKVFECNMNLLDEEKVELLKENNFTYLSFGVQTFNERILAKNNRVNFDTRKIKEIVSNLQSQGIYVNCDLLTFIDNGDESDIPDTISDLYIMTNYIKPNKISLHAKRCEIVTDPQRGVKKVEMLRKKMFQNLSKINGYTLPQVDDDPSFFAPSVEDRTYVSDYLFYKSKEDYDNRFKYNSSSFSDCPIYQQSALGIGSFRNHKAYSYTEDVFFVENNFNWHPRYMVVQKINELRNNPIVSNQN